MSTISRETVDNIVNSCVSYFRGHTMCGLTQDYVMAALSKNWSSSTLAKPSPDDYFSPYWTKYLYYNPCSQQKNIIDLMEDKLKKHGFLRIDIDLNHGIAHSFVVVLTTEHTCSSSPGTEQFIVDSYIHIHRPEIRSFDITKDLGRFLAELTCVCWNEIFHCNEDINKKIDIDDISLMFSYHEPGVIGKYHEIE